ncbi:DMT family transporter [Pseudokordiimonas caeni]|uniref:DMT family transporter n=1 Tax=Pseudokordiimonas caeni TaxID=2997908 RepID=UPI0028123951|nr:DMT family transporter [Pseudokordiimonas caeni]
MKAIIAFVGCVLIWGSTWYAIEWQLGTTTPEWSVAFRFGLACIITFVIAIARRERLRFTLKDHAVVAGFGVFMFSLNYILVYHGTEHLPSGLVAVTFSLLALMNLINARLFLKTPIAPTAFAASILGVLGLVLIFLPEIEVLSFEDQTVLGVVICVFGTFLASIGNNFAATPRARALPLFAANAWGLFYGSISNVVNALITGDPIVLDPRPEYWMALGYLAVMGTVVAFALYIWLIGQIGVAGAAYTSVLIPFVALAISTVFENFHWTLPAVLGVGLVAVGNVLMVRSRSRPAA